MLAALQYNRPVVFVSDYPVFYQYLDAQMDGAAAAVDWSKCIYVSLQYSHFNPLLVPEAGTPLQLLARSFERSDWWMVC